MQGFYLNMGLRKKEWKEGKRKDRACSPLWILIETDPSDPLWATTELGFFEEINAVADHTPYQGCSYQGWHICV